MQQTDEMNLISIHIRVNWKCNESLVYRGLRTIIIYKTIRSIYLGGNRRCGVSLLVVIN